MSRLLQLGTETHAEIQGNVPGGDVSNQRCMKLVWQRQPRAAAGMCFSWFYSFVWMHLLCFSCFFYTQSLLHLLKRQIKRIKLSSAHSVVLIMIEHMMPNRQNNR